MPLFVTFLMNLAILKPPLLLSLIIARLLAALPMIPCDNNGPRPWTCVSIGFTIGCAREISYLLEKGNFKSCRLLYQTPSGRSPATSPAFTPNVYILLLARPVLHPNYYACLESDDISVPTSTLVAPYQVSAAAAPFTPTSGGEGVLISKYRAPHKRSMALTNTATRLGTCCTPAIMPQ